MAKAISFYPEARKEFDQSFNWYLDRSTDGAIGFDAAFDEALAAIALDPDRFPTTEHDCRYCKLQRYPFRVIFFEEMNRIWVVSVSHTSRRSDHWHGRMNS